ncbi:MAG: hypothetical protein WB615_10310 [Candidatus Tumulicola sp.]
MRFFTSSLALAFLALALTACAGKSSSNSDQSNATASAEATAAASSSPDSMASDSSMASGEASSAPNTAAVSGDIPAYPGATTQASGSTSGMAAQNASGKILTTGDSFDKVYAFYQKNMPAGSERAHLTSPGPSALFVVVGADKSQASVSIATNEGKTVITIAHVKMQSK